MGKNRKVNSHRKAIGKRSKHIKVTAKDIPGVIQGLGISLIIAILFYKSIWGLLVSIVVVPFWTIEFRERRIEKETRRMKQEFKEYMLLVSNSLQTGYSLEKSLRQAEEELKKLYGKDCVIRKLIHEMNQRIGVNIPTEKAFLEFAKATGLEEAESLGEILSFAKRTGGDYGKHIKSTASKIEDKLAVQEEIDTLTAEKQLELKVMCVMPMGILGYIALTSADFISPLYGNITGIAVMSACLVAYGAMIVIGRKIVTINV